MKKSNISFENIRFERSTLTNIPNLKTPEGIPLFEVVIAGRSNVGKSSLINHLSKRRDIARVSPMPGKTTCLNFFVVDSTLLLVDLPGYGFAKQSKKAQEIWSQAIDQYLTSRKSLKLICLLIDIRRDLSEEDQNLINWAKAHQKHLLIIFTKSDTLPQSQVGLKKENLEHQIGPADSLYYSIKEGKSRLVLIKKLNQLVDLLWDN